MKIQKSDKYIAGEGALEISGQYSGLVTVPEIILNIDNMKIGEDFEVNIGILDDNLKKTNPTINDTKTLEVIVFTVVDELNVNVEIRCGGYYTKVIPKTELKEFYRSGSSLKFCNNYIDK